MHIRIVVDRLMLTRFRQQIVLHALVFERLSLGVGIDPHLTVIRRHGARNIFDSLMRASYCMLPF